MSRHEARRVALLVLREELADRDVDLARAQDALRAAEESLLPYPRSEWPVPSNRWEQTCVAIATAAVRLVGRFPRVSALAALRTVLDDVASERVA